MDYLDTKGRVFDVQKYSIHDGDGKIREITNCNRKRIFGAGVRGWHGVIGIKMFIGF